MRAGALLETLIPVRAGTGDSDEMRLAVTVPESLGLRGETLTVGLPDIFGGVAVAGEETERVGPAEGEAIEGAAATCFNTETVDKDLVTLGEAEGRVFPTLGDADAEGDTEGLVLVIRFISVCLVALDFGVVTAGVRADAAFSVLDVLSGMLGAEVDLPTPTMGDLLPDFSARLACSLRVLSMSCLVLASCSCRATLLAYDS